MFTPQIFYKDDLNWLKGIGCYAWDTPEILRVKQSGIIQSEVSRPTPLYFTFCGCHSGDIQLSFLLLLLFLSILLATQTTFTKYPL